MIFKNEETRSRSELLINLKFLAIDVTTMHSAIWKCPKWIASM
jgi:hypothetical protein